MNPAMRANHPWTKRYRLRTYIVAGVAVVVPLALVGIFLFLFRGVIPNKYYGFFGLLGLVGVGQLIWLLPVRHRVAKHDGEICGNCLFVLTDLPTEGICPECGSTYEIQQTRSGWQQDLKLKLKNPPTPAQEKTAP